jgi:hypothetical protein
METISNGQPFLRIVAAAAVIGTLGFVCGYFGPLYLLKDAGVGPVTGFFIGPLGAAIGVATAMHSSRNPKTAKQFVCRLLIVSSIFAAATIVLVALQ